jgi:hypothetical protein
MRRKHNLSVMITVHEADAHAFFPVTVTFESGSEWYGTVRTLEEVWALAKEHKFRMRDVLFRGRSRLDIVR